MLTAITEGVQSVFSLMTGLLQQMLGNWIILVLLMISLIATAMSLVFRLIKLPRGKRRRKAKA